MPALTATSVLMSTLVVTGAAAQAPAPGTHARYAVLTAQWHAAPPFDFFDLAYGPPAEVDGEAWLWWELRLPAAAKTEERGQPSPPMILRALTSRDPLGDPGEPLRFARYLLHLPAVGETLEYRDVHTGRALLPPWKDFERHFVPRRAEGVRLRDGLPETAVWLGHILTLQSTRAAAEWEQWDDLRFLDLDREMLVGTGRNFRDAEGHRLPQQPERRNYTYVKFERHDYPVMMEAGFNLFIADREQWAWVRGEPVFYLGGAAGTADFAYPGELYRSNYLGPVMFMDEPAIIMVGDRNVHHTLLHFSDAAELLQRRIRWRYRHGDSYSAFQLERSLRQAGYNLGEMTLEQHDYPAWETLYQTAWYQLRAGLAGIVHEGRYRLEPFDEAVAKWTDERRRHTPEELLRYHYAFLRGAARAFDAHWGTAIYGQCDPAIAPLALTLAYDMGARYFWFWTSDHDHHLPWPEQLELARHLTGHAAAHPRPSIRRPAPTLDTAIAIPYGSFLDLGNLWWVRSLEPGRQTGHIERYERLMRRAHAAIQEAMDRGEEFDLVVDEGQRFEGYRRVVPISDAP